MASTASVFRHPIHPMLIPLPIGLWIFSLVSDFVYFASSNLIWKAVAYYTMAGGTAGALLAALPGFVDLFTMKPSPAKRIGLWHMGVNLVIVVLYIVNLAWRQSASTSNGAVGLSCAAAILLAVSGWLGGEMVYVLGVAVEPPGRSEDGR